MGARIRTASSTSPRGSDRFGYAGQQLLQAGQWRIIGSRLCLSPRELQITRCVFDDLTDTAIAGELGIGVNTVHSHFERLYKKLGIRSRSALVVRVFREYMSQQPGPAKGARNPWAFAGGIPSKAHT